MEWTRDHLKSLLAQCDYEIKFNQPPNPDLLKFMTIWINGTAYGNATTRNITLPIQPQFTPEYLEAFEGVSCENDCNGRGECENGIFEYI